MRARWIYKDGHAIPADEFVRDPQADFYVQGDIQPYQSMVTGEMIGSRSTHRAHLKQHGVIEVGNEKPPPKKYGPPPGLKDALIRQVNDWEEAKRTGRKYGQR